MKNNIKELQEYNEKIMCKLELMKKHILKQSKYKKLKKMFLSFSVSTSHKKGIELYCFVVKNNDEVFYSHKIEDFCIFFHLNISKIKKMLELYRNIPIYWKPVNKNIEQKIHIGILCKIFFENFLQKSYIEPFTLIRYKNKKTKQEYSIGYRKNINKKLAYHNKKKYLYLLQSTTRKNIPNILNLKEYYLFPDVSSLLLHEACGHFLEADMVLLKSTPFSVKSKEETITNKEIEIVSENNGIYMGGSFFDDEGTDGQTVLLLKKGKIKEFMVDSKLEFLIDTPKKGNYRCQNFLDIAPHIRMTNFIVKNSKNKMNYKNAVCLSNVQKIVVRGNGDFDCVFNNFFYKNKKYDCKLLYRDNIKNFLKKITEIYDDQIAFTGECYKGSLEKGEYFMVTNASPSIKVLNFFIQKI